MGRQSALVMGIAVLWGLALSSGTAHAQAFQQLSVAARTPVSAAPGPRLPPLPDCRTSRNVGALIGGAIGLGVGIDVAAQLIRKSAVPAVGVAFAPVFVFLPAVGGIFLGSGVGELVCAVRG